MYRVLVHAIGVPQPRFERLSGEFQGNYGRGYDPQLTNELLHLQEDHKDDALCSTLFTTPSILLTWRLYKLFDFPAVISGRAYLASPFFRDYPLFIRYA